MKKQWFYRIVSLLTWNLIIATAILFLLKMLRNIENPVNLIQWMQDDTKKFALYLSIIFLLLLTTLKFQMKILLILENKYAWVLRILKYTFIFILSLTLSIIVNYYFQYFQMLRDPVLTIEWMRANTRIIFAGVLYILFIYLLAFALIGNIYISSLFTTFILLAIGFTHYNKLNLRVEPLYPADYKQIGALKDVIPMITEFISVSNIVLILLLFVVMGIAVLFLPKLKVALWMRGLLLVLAVTMLYSYTNFPNTFMNDFVKKNNVEIVKWNQIENYKTNGFLFGFLSNINNVILEKPENYSEQEVVNTAEKYITYSSNLENNDQKPNIIYLMSESFWDPTKLDIEFSGDPLKNMRPLMDKHSSGALFSPVFGAATANVEFEALTGFTTSFLKIGGIPYQDVIDKKEFIPTIVSDLELKGYRSLAIHPYNRVFYKRNVVYDIFGIDEFLDMDTMKYTDRTPGGVISDASLSYEILEHIRKTDDPLFIHAVSMQNHMPYNEGAYEDHKIQVSGLSPESNTTVEVFTEGIRRSDVALKLLVDELEKLDEPTIIVFWGDHLPILGADQAIYKEAGYEHEDKNVQNQMFAETPLLIYSNYEIERRDLESVSPNYLAPLVYELSGLKKPPFYNLLDKMREEIPGLKSDLKIGKNNEYITELTEEQAELLADYKMLEYDLLIGKQYSLDILYPQK